MIQRTFRVLCLLLALVTIGRSALIPRDVRLPDDSYEDADQDVGFVQDYYSADDADYQGVQEHPERFHPDLEPDLEPEDHPDDDDDDEDDEDGGAQGPSDNDEDDAGGDEHPFVKNVPENPLRAFFTNPFYDLKQVRQYFHELERALERVFRQTVDEARLLNSTYANTTEEEVEIGGRKYLIQKSIISGGDNDSAIYVETLTSKSKPQGVNGMEVRKETKKNV